MRKIRIFDVDKYYRSIISQLEYHTVLKEINSEHEKESISNELLYKMILFGISKCLNENFHFNLPKIHLEFLDTIQPA